MIYLSNDPYPQEISIPRSFGVIVPQRKVYLTEDDIATDLETDSDRKVLAASQGVALKRLVDEKADAEDVYTKSQVDDALAGKANVSDIPDVSQFITRSVDDLANYYLKSETYTQQEVRDLIAAINQFHYEVYASLSDVTDPQSNVLYLIGPTGTGGDKYEEYVFTTEWVKIGDTSIDLSGYVTTQALNTALADYVTNSALATALAEKQDTLESGVNIKTINGESLLGGGNISIQAEPEIFWATYGVTTASQIDQAVADGKVVMCIYDNVFYSLARTETANHYFSQFRQNRLYTLVVNRSTNAWTAQSAIVEYNSNKSQDIPTDRESTTKYPSVKAVFDSLGKWGIVSQTQTWSGTGTNPRTYTMSGQVWGLIPQANIDLYEANGAVFNANTGYFELNGLTDISYNEMKAIYALTIGAVPISSSRGFQFANLAVRTPLLLMGTSSFATSLQYWFYNSTVEIVKTQNQYCTHANFVGAFRGCGRLRRVDGVISSSIILGTAAALSSSFLQCYSLEHIQIGKLAGNVSFSDSSLLDLESIVYAVDNAANTTAITITLHATAYARCQADTTEYTYNEQTYTGIIAYAAAKNITIASA